ncbi:MAG: sulfatase-like hydrolase/transferase [Salinivirgaceae bacterium]|nr:sulfatase-like hydrolase/transferase [Salinivirgaceae bacterium]
MKNIRYILPSYLKYLLSHYFLGLFFFLVFRIILFASYFLGHGLNNVGFYIIKRAFLKGLQFDSVVMGYIILVPLFFLILMQFIKENKIVFKIVNFYILSLVFVTFLISSADIPYFNYNFSRISAVIFEWISDTGTIASMIIEEPSYLIFIFVFIVLFVAYFLLSRRIFGSFMKNLRPDLIKKNIAFRIGISIIAMFMVFVAIRGRIDSPIRVNHAFFCNNSFYNQLGLNPTFALIKSLQQNMSIKVIKDEEALANVSSYFGLETNKIHKKYISREVLSNDPILRKNVILVLMESMSANKLGYYGNADNLTPFLDSLSNESMFFRNIYSSGRHTCNGIFSTLYSYPAVFRDHPMSSVDIKHYSSLPEVFKENGYHNIYFTTHSEIFDNVGVFLPQNDFDEIISQKNYDQKEIQNAFGIPDHILFNHVIEKLDVLALQDSLFFATVMTISDHGPYIIPKDIAFTPKTNDIKKQIVEYSDWSIRQFIKIAATKEWYKNSIFVFVADHGAIMEDASYEIPLSLHHIPFIVFSPDETIIQDSVHLNFGCQMDVLPTVAGILNLNYTNNTFGVNLLKEKRPYSYFSSDDKLGCVDDDFFYIYKVNGDDLLYKLKDAEMKNIAHEIPEKLNAMKKYVISMTQAAKWYIMHDKTDL